MARAGQFRDRVTFERLDENATDDHGDLATAWATLVTVWGDLREQPGREALAAGRLQDSKLATLRVRGSAAMRAVTGADRVVARGETWNIKSLPVQIDRAGAVLEFIIETGVAV